VLRLDISPIKLASQQPAYAGLSAARQHSPDLCGGPPGPTLGRPHPARLKRRGDLPQAGLLGHDALGPQPVQHRPQLGQPRLRQLGVRRPRHARRGRRARPSRGLPSLVPRAFAAARAARVRCPVSPASSSATQAFSRARENWILLRIQVFGGVFVFSMV